MGFYMDAVFVNDLLFYRSPGALKISGSPWNCVPMMISGSAGTQFSSMIFNSDIVHGH